MSDNPIDPATEGQALRFLFAMGELSGNVKALTTEMKEFRQDVQRDGAKRDLRTDNIEARVKKLELWQVYVTGGAATGAVFLTKLVEWLSHGRPF